MLLFVCLFVVIINNNNYDYDNDEINMKNSLMETPRLLRW